MNCKEFEKNIPEFIAGKLDFLTLQEFGEHMQECPGCKEELVIQFLVTEVCSVWKTVMLLTCRENWNSPDGGKAQGEDSYVFFEGRSCTGSDHGDFSPGISRMDHLVACNCM